MTPIQRARFQHKHPILSSLLERRTIYVDNEEYVGVASDGTKLGMGVVGAERNLESYLKEHPTPDTW